MSQYLVACPAGTNTVPKNLGEIAEPEQNRRLPGFLITRLSSVLMENNVPLIAWLLLSSKGAVGTMVGCVYRFFMARTILLR